MKTEGEINNFQVLAVDPDNYAIFYVCSHDPMDRLMLKGERIYIFGKKPKIEDMSDAAQTTLE